MTHAITQQCLLNRLKLQKAKTRCFISLIGAYNRLIQKKKDRCKEGLVHSGEVKVELLLA